MKDEYAFYFYVLECRDGSFYAGYTNNLERRLKVHNEGKGSKYTRVRLPVVYCFYKGFATKSGAMRAEVAFKRLKRKEKEAVVNGEATEFFGGIG